MYKALRMLLAWTEAYDGSSHYGLLFIKCLPQARSPLPSLSPGPPDNPVKQRLSSLHLGLKAGLWHKAPGY